MNKLIMNIAVTLSAIFGAVACVPVVSTAAEYITITATAEGVAFDVQDDEKEDLPTLEDDDFDKVFNETVDKYINLLIEKYGDDYAKYYEVIIDKYGSIEAYIDSFMNENVHDQNVLDWWAEVKSWLEDYKTIWGGILAVLFIAFVALFGRTAWVRATSYVKKFIKSINMIFTALQVNLEATKALLGNNEKFADLRAKIEKTEKDMEKDV